MGSEQRQVHQTVVFLRTSFEAVQHSIAGRLEDPLPCWLDTGLLSMLSRDLTRCCEQTRPLFVASVSEQLFVATRQCELLLKQCPGALNSAVCYRQLGTIVIALTSALQQMAQPEPRRRWFWQP